MALEAPVQVIVQRDRARRRISSAAIAAWVQAGITLLLVLFVAREGPVFEQLGWWTYIDVILVAGLGAGMLVAPRAAGIVLIGVLALSTMNKLVMYGPPSGLVGALIFGFFYVEGLRGAFTLAALTRTEGGVEEIGPSEAGHGV